MYGPKEMYGNDHSVIFSTRVTTHCTVHSITYGYKWISYPVYSRYNNNIFWERHGVESNISRTVKVIVAAS
jgi:hypothetical protein